MRRRLGYAQTGFTLIELLIVIAIIGILAGMLIPNLLDTMQKAKQKRTVADMRITGTAMFAWLSDQVGAAAAGSAATQISVGDYSTGALTSSTGIAGVLVPHYTQAIPVVDGWKTTYLYRLKTGTNVLDRQVMLIGSGGRDRNAPSGTYTVAGFEPTDYDQDLIWADGFFARWPQK